MLTPITKHETYKDTIQFIAAWEFLYKLQITQPQFIISYTSFHITLHSVEFRIFSNTLETHKNPQSTDLFYETR